MYTQLVNFAHAVGHADETSQSVDDSASLALRVVVIALLSLFILVILASSSKDKAPRMKMPLFVLVAATLAVSMMVLVISALDLNKGSDSDGPVDWQASYEIWTCGNQLELRDPDGFMSNKIGSPILHEHDDQSIHVNGVVEHVEIDASLGGFFHEVGGELSDGRLIVPLNDESGRWFEDSLDSDGSTENNTAFITINIISDKESGTLADFADGGFCGPDPAVVQTYVYHYEETDSGKVFWQEKLANPAQYTITEESSVPPGDCIIFEYGPESDRTERICESFDELGAEVREVGTVTEAGEVVELDELRSTEPTEIKPLEGLEGLEDSND